MAVVVSDAIRFTKQPYIEDVGPRKIKSMKFSIFSGTEINKAAEVQVWSSQYYDQQRLPVPNGLLDPRMGPPSKSGTCATCYANFVDCPGHFGYVKLCLPVFNLGYFGTILNVLKSICKSCARILLLDNDRMNYLKRMRNPRMEVLQKEALFKQVIKKCKATCGRCGYVNGVVKKGKAAMIIVHDRSKINDGGFEECSKAISHTKESRASFQVVHVLNPCRVLALFKRMQEEDCELLYLSDRPEKLLLTDIAVPPIAIRPSVVMDGGKHSNEDEVTTRLKLIIEANARLRMDLECTSSSPQRLADWESLQAEVAQYINSEVRGIPPNLQQARPLRGFIQRLKGKQGRFRGNLSGKRVEYTGRTVISPDPNLKVTEVGIPILMAQILAYPERVSHQNIEKLRQCIRNGPQTYPGANFIKHPDGSTINLKFDSARKHAADNLDYGWIVERHLENGDVVLFNRQPSLHRMSIMSHRARVMPWRTLRFNESVCNPYNADFDGDEMNMHVPQTEEARTEALMLMGVQNNLCTPKNGEILVASTQDFLTSSFLITRKDTFYDRAAFSLMCTYMGDGMDPVDLPTPALIKPMELWTGKQLFDVLIRPHAKMRVYLNLTVKEKIYSVGETMCPNDGYVYFRNSELLCGQLGKATLGNGNKDGLFSVLLRDYSAHAATACMNRLAKLSARWIGNHGFSIGIDDVQPGDYLNHQKNQRIDESYKACDELIQSFEKGSLKSEAGCDAAQTLEGRISEILNDTRGKAAKVCMKELPWRNSPLVMSQCGSKGSPDNISQMVACVGQQSVGGRRAPDGFIDRSLPHFTRKSKKHAAKGFVANSFYTGLRATEFFFHTMAGREGLVDTAVKTADTGYMSRRLIKSLEDLSIQYDSTVRSASSDVIQFLYGDDGLDPSGMEGENDTPLNLERLFLKAKATCPARAHARMSPSEISKFVEERLTTDEKLASEKHEGIESAENRHGEFKRSLLNFFEAHISRLRNTRRALNLDENYDEKNKSNFLEKIAANISGITLQQLKVFLDTCISRYHSKRIEAGTAIGAIGAQSIGEPGTQMTLKTFHFAGLASMNVTLGVPRIKEIINGAKNIKVPIITAILEQDDDPKSAESVKTRIQKTVLEEVAESILLVMTTRNGSIVVTLDMEMIHSSQLGICGYSVKQSILNHPRIKLKTQHIEVLDDRQLRIHSPEGDRSKLHFELQSLKSMLRKVVVKGIATVERAIIITEKGKTKLNVEGTNFLAVMGTPGVDGCKTKCNHIIEVQGTLGIEAARQCIVDEIQYVMSNHKMRIDIRHMMLLADVMTSKGEVLGVTRFGIQKMKDSVLMLASFEKTSDHLFNASVNGRDDKIEGVSECIIMGIPMQIGTGILKVRQRVEPAPKLNYAFNPIIS